MGGGSSNPARKVPRVEPATHDDKAHPLALATVMVGPPMWLKPAGQRHSSPFAQCGQRLTDNTEADNREQLLLRPGVSPDHRARDERTGTARAHLRIPRQPAENADEACRRRHDRALSVR